MPSTVTYWRGLLLVLNEALGAYWQAATKAPGDHHLLPQFLNNLATSYLDLFQRTGNKNVFDEALRLIERATELEPPGSFGSRLYLANLGGALKTKFFYTREPADLDRAVDVHRRVVREAPEEPVTLAGLLTGLGNTLLTRVELNGSSKDLEEAIDLLQRAVEFTPDTSPHRVLILNTLCHGLALRHDKTNNGEGLKELRVTSEKVCKISLDSNVALEEGLKCARSWGDWEFGWGAWREAARAYDYAEQIFGRLLRVQLFRQGKELWLTELQGLSGKMAFALAKEGDLSGAATALERGRAKLLTETLDRDRADLEHLRGSGRMELYARYASAVEQSSALLEMASMPPDTPSTYLPDATELTDALKASRDELDAVTEDIRGVPGYELFQLPSSFEEIQSIATDTPLVYLTTTSAGSLALVVTTEGARVGWLDVTEQELNDLLITMGPEGGPEGEPHMFPIVGGYVYAQVVDPRYLGESLEELLPVLGEKIMSTIAGLLRNAKTQETILIPNGQLGSVPLHAAGYEVGGRAVCFLDEFDVSYAPNARSLGIAKRSLACSQIEPYLVGVGNPLPTREASLEWAGFELEGIAALFEGSAHPLYEHAATKSALEEVIQDATYLHLDECCEV